MRKICSDVNTSCKYMFADKITLYSCGSASLSNAFFPSYVRLFIPSRIIKNDHPEF